MCSIKMCTRWYKKHKKHCFKIMKNLKLHLRNYSFQNMCCLKSCVLFKLLFSCCQLKIAILCDSDYLHNQLQWQLFNHNKYLVNKSMGHLTNKWIISEPLNRSFKERFDELFDYFSGPFSESFSDSYSVGFVGSLNNFSRPYNRPVIESFNESFNVSFSFMTQGCFKALVFG